MIRSHVTRALLAALLLAPAGCAHQSHVHDAASVARPAEDPALLAARGEPLDGTLIAGVGCNLEPLEANGLRVAGRFRAAPPAMPQTHWLDVVVINTLDVRHEARVESVSMSDARTSRHADLRAALAPGEARRELGLASWALNTPPGGDAGERVLAVSVVHHPHRGSVYRDTFRWRVRMTE